MGIFNNGDFRMDKRVYLVFALVAAMAITNAVLSTLKIRNNKNAIFEITQYSNPSLESLEEFNLIVTRSRMYISNWVYLPNNKADKDQLVKLNIYLYPELKQKLTLLANGWKNNSNPAQLSKLFSDYEAIIREQNKIMSSLVLFDDYQDPMKKFLAEEQLESEIIPATNRMMASLRELIAVKKQETAVMQDAMLEDNMYLLVIVFTLAILVIMSVMMAGYYLMRQVIMPLVHVRGTLLKMSAGELPEITPDNKRSALSEMKQALVQLKDRLSRTSVFAREIGSGHFNAEFQPLSEKDVLGTALLEMRDKLSHAADDDSQRNWSAEGYTRINTILHQSSGSLTVLATELVNEIVPYVDAQQGAIYLLNDSSPDEMYIETLAAFAPPADGTTSTKIPLGTSLVGQVIASKNKMHLKRAAHVVKHLETAVSEILVSDIYIVPLYAGGMVVGALEIRSVVELKPSHTAFLDQIAEPIASNMMNLKASLLTHKLLDESRQKTQELAEQDEELRMINNELMRQSGRLKQSELELMRQQEVLRKVNSELEQKAIQLEEKSQVIEEARKAIALKADQLEKSNKYKSDFLANMSHELRTPLNSVLILAKLLSENKAGNMNEKQVEHARVIHKSGKDLLVIINDILDLSKIEAGKLELVLESIACTEISGNMQRLFNEVSREKQIDFRIVQELESPDVMVTDRVRVEQVLKNLLSNAFKFTPAHGIVTLETHIEKSESARVCFKVSDTGIGIPAEKQQLIFEAFNQADSSITRKYGGTGLGLAICNQLATLLGGEITLVSEEGKGATFCFYLPLISKAPAETTVTAKPSGQTVEQAEDMGNSSTMGETDSELNHDSPRPSNDHAQLQKQSAAKTDRNRLKSIRLLIADSNVRNIYSMTTFLEQEGATVVYAMDGNEVLTMLLSGIQPDFVLIDMMMPVKDGITVIREIRQIERFSNLPLIAITPGMKEGEGELCIAAGATAFITRPLFNEDLITLLSNKAGQLPVNTKSISK